MNIISVKLHLVEFLYHTSVLWCWQTWHAAVVVTVASNKPNPAQIMDKVNNVDGSFTCESCYGKHTFGVYLVCEEKLKKM